MIVLQRIQDENQMREAVKGGCRRDQPACSKDEEIVVEEQLSTDGQADRQSACNTDDGNGEEEADYCLVSCQLLEVSAIRRVRSNLEDVLSYSPRVLNLVQSCRIVRFGKEGVHG